MEHVIGFITEKVVLGLASYRAECQTCGWKSEGFDKPEQAVAANKRHCEKKH
jgi:hypothetical protein